MQTLVFTAALSIFSVAVSNHVRLRSLEDLIVKKDPAWPLVRSWVENARNKVEVLPADPRASGESLYEAQVTTRSPIGAIVYMTGGILVDSGWIRILGSGHPKLTRSLPSWNKGKTSTLPGTPPPFLLIADDAIGGFFMLNGGGLGNDPGKIYYLSPNKLIYESLGLTYTEFLHFCFNSDLDEFYGPMRWQGWEEEVCRLHGDQVFSAPTPLWERPFGDMAGESRIRIPVGDMYVQMLTRKAKLYPGNKN